jgi:hypothetical protein
MTPTAIFYHCVFIIDGVILAECANIVQRQMAQLEQSGLLGVCNEFHVGVNGGLESEKFVQAYIPAKARVTYHGASSRSENPTIVMLEEWVNTHPGWNVLYFHSKGVTHKPGTFESKKSRVWREGMMADLVTRWRFCVSQLERGFDIVAALWMWGMCDGTQHIPAGNFLWIKSDFAAKLPSILLRDRIKQDGIAAATSRFEAEVYWGNGPRPNVYSCRDLGWWQELNSFAVML